LIHLLHFIFLILYSLFRVRRCRLPVCAPLTPFSTYLVGETIEQLNDLSVKVSEVKLS
jgi:hypothetical protein